MLWKVFTHILGILTQSTTLPMYYSVRLVGGQLVMSHSRKLYMPLLSCLIVKRFGVFINLSDVYILFHVSNIARDCFC